MIPKRLCVAGLNERATNWNMMLKRKDLDSFCAELSMYNLYMLLDFLSAYLIFKATYQNSMTFYISGQALQVVGQT
jgi:hypothetical protein